MGVTKTDNFTQEQNRLAALAKALAHPARVAILQELLKRQACICGDLVEVVPLAQATVSQHLKELKKAGLIQGTVEGTSVCYCIDPRAWQQTKAVFQQLFGQEVEAPGNCC
ncbi:ArsR/SmtB family transcription factor [Rufibacter quisquiliarum]|uniref:DNA-binding transcriptional ArsR family regulator n=1 Tax=Rufibacter quisquiliarum TaxID=1549639 RepID=A0A839G9N2_9BACT|nr:metalloregulator ArsR/SmtB family transcription factor [Rufibacter quisquiliarum]MBA9075672.1 DNA-binding transcriptional ArsR family regulator [Rufibacter quisquiliarum]